MEPISLAFVFPKKGFLMRFSARPALIGLANRGVLAASLAVLMATVAWSCDQCGSVGGCEPGCGVGIMSCDSGCDSGGCNSCSRGGIASRGGVPNGPIFKTLDAVAGGIESLIGKCNRKGSSACDACDGCDAAMIHDLSQAPCGCSSCGSSQHVQSLPIQSHLPPISSPIIHPHIQSPTPMAPRMPSVPPENFGAPIQMQPRGMMQVQPHIDQPLAPQGEIVPRATTPRTVTPPLPSRLPDPAPQDTQPRQSQPNTPGNIFDKIDDPFGDDEVRARPKRQFIQRASYRETSPSPVRVTRTYVQPAYPKPTAAPSRASNAHRPVQHRQPQHQHNHRATSPAPQGLLGQIFGTRTGAGSTAHHHQHSRQSQVQLRPAPNQQRGQRHASVRSGAYGHTTAR